MTDIDDSVSTKTTVSIVTTTTRDSLADVCQVVKKQMAMFIRAMLARLAVAE